MSGIYSRAVRRGKGNHKLAGQTTKVLHRGDDRIKVVMGIRPVDQSDELGVGSRRSSKALPMAVSLSASVGSLTEGESRDRVMRHSASSPCNNCQGLIMNYLCGKQKKCPPKIYP